MICVGPRMAHGQLLQSSATHVKVARCITGVMTARSQKGDSLCVRLYTGSAWH